MAAGTPFFHKMYNINWEQARKYTMIPQNLKANKKL